MDAVKFAFETTIVGLLALPWLARLLTFFVPRFQIRRVEDNRLLSLLEPTALTVLLFLTLAYFMGSAVLPISTQLLDDQDMPIRKIREIRADLNDVHIAWFETDLSLRAPNKALTSAVSQFRKNCQEPYPGASKLPSPKWWRASLVKQDCWKSAEDMFLIQEQIVLQQGTEKTEQISRLHEQVIVLRGAVLNSFIFAVLCWFAYFSPRPHEPIRSIPLRLRMRFKALTSNCVMPFKALMLFGLVGVLFSVALVVGKPDLRHHDVTDPPIMEVSLFILGLIGLFAFFKGVTKGPHPFVALLFSFAFTLLAYGAWQWTEVLYTDNVIGAFFAPR